MKLIKHTCDNCEEIYYDTNTDIKGENFCSECINEYESILEEQNSNYWHDTCGSIGK